MKLKRLIALIALMAMPACVPQPPKPPQPPATVDSTIAIVTSDGLTAMNLVVDGWTDDQGAPHVDCPPVAVNTATCTTSGPAGNGLNTHAVADGYDPNDGRGLIGGTTTIALQKTPPPPPPLPPPPTRQQLLTMQTAMYGLRCNVPSLGGDIPWWDPGIQALADPAERLAVYGCKKKRGDNGIIIGPGLYSTVLYDEPDNPYQVQIPTFDVAARVLENAQNGFMTDLYMDGDALGWQVAMDEFPIVYNKLLQGGPPKGKQDLNQYVNYRPAWDGWFYGIPETQIMAWAAMARSTCPYCVITFEFNTGHLPLGEGGADFLPGGRMKDFDGVKIEFDCCGADALHNDNTWQIVVRLIGPAYVKPADDPNGAAPWYMAQPTSRGPWGVECFEPPTYGWVRNRIPQAQADADRLYLQTLGCPVVD